MLADIQTERRDFGGRAVRLGLGWLQQVPSLQNCPPAAGFQPEALGSLHPCSQNNGQRSWNRWCWRPSSKSGRWGGRMYLCQGQERQEVLSVTPHLVARERSLPSTHLTISLSCSKPFHGSQVLPQEFAVVVKSLSHVWRFMTPWTRACQAFLSFTVSWSLLTFMSIEWWEPTGVLCMSVHLRVTCHGSSLQSPV